MAIEPIDDLDDPRLADYAHLRAPSTRQRLEQQLGIFTVEGWLSVEALLASPYPVRSVLVTTDQLRRAEVLQAGAVPVYGIAADALADVTGVNFHRGVLAVADRPRLPSVREVTVGASLVLVLEGVNDHENIGALFRNAAAFGVDAVLLDPTSADPLYRRATRVSLGHVLRVPFARVPDGGWPSTLDDLKADGIETWALTPAPDAEPLRHAVAHAAPRVGLLVGAEGPGLSAAALGAADRRVRIPMADGVDSVNVATAAAIALAALHDRG